MNCPICQEENWIEGAFSIAPNNPPHLFFPKLQILATMPHVTVAARACRHCGFLSTSVDPVELEAAVAEDDLKQMDKFFDEFDNSVVHPEEPVKDFPMCPVGWDRKKEIREFIHWCGQPYERPPDLSKGRADEIALHYFAGIRSLSDEGVCQVLRSMRQSIEEATLKLRQSIKVKRKSRALDRWKGCCTGVAEYLLPKDLDGRDRVAVAKALQRLSGWYHADIGLHKAFQRPAKTIGDIICGEGVLRYLKIGEEWVCDRSRVDPAKVAKKNGYMYLWSFAEGVPNKVRTGAKQSEETRTLASRLLCFLCEEDYIPGSLEKWYEYIISQFPGYGRPGFDPWVLPTNRRLRQKHPLLRWDVGSPFVYMLAKGIVVQADAIIAFLRDRAFNPDTTYNPNGEKRLAWFKRWKKLKKPDGET